MRRGPANTEFVQSGAVTDLSDEPDDDAFRPLAKQLKGYWQQMRLAALDAGGRADEVSQR